MIALATLAGVAFLAIREKRFPKISWERETFLLLFLWPMFTLTTVTALRPDLAWPEWQDISKTYLMALVTLLVLRDEKQLRYLLLVIALSFGFYGAKGGLFAIVSGGQYRVWGPEASFIEDNNALGLALNMVLPFFFYLAKSEPIWWLKRLLQMTFFLTILAVLFTYSRGAFLGLAVVMGLIFLGLKFRQKVAIAGILLVLIPLTMSMIPDKWYDRMATIQTYGEDNSVVSRFEAWEVAWKLALDNPLTGGGFQIINDEVMYDRYKPESILRTGVHSIYFEILGENGFITLGIFVLLLLCSLATLVRIRRLARKHELEDYYCYGSMLLISISAYAVSGTFLEFASFELFYQIIALVIILKALFREKLQRIQAKTASNEKLALAAQSSRLGVNRGN
jgi:probable O-glycosylation ligase (exosortase A-associated)